MMKLKINGSLGKLKKGDEVEIDKIKFAPDNAGAFALRVVGVWKKPVWVSIAWFIDIPKGVDWALRDTAKREMEQK